MPDEFGKHEVYDRASLIAELFDEKVAQHPAVIANQKLHVLARNLTDALVEFYETAVNELMERTHA